MDSIGAPSDAVPKIQVRFFGPIREAAKKSGDDLDFLPGMSVYDLLLALSGIYGESVRAELLYENAPGGLRDDLIITQNEAIIDHARASDAGIEVGDVVALFQTFPGGG